jgi:hypothetical protein
MAATPIQPRTKPGEGIIGIRMPAHLIADLKTEARARKMSVGKLIQELWTDHRSKRKPAPSR